MAERKAILQDARMLSKFASWCKNVTQPVEVVGTATARNFFDRPSAGPATTVEEEREHDAILRDAISLKKYAVHFHHAEMEIKVDATAFGRNYFGRVSAEPYEDLEKDEEAAKLANEREMILADSLQLKTLAAWYAHPERPIQVDALCFGRNYYGRASALDCENAEEDEERDLVLADAAKLKVFANFYAHPEAPLVMDGFATGRNYFTRASAPEYDDDEDEIDERTRILEEVSKLKKHAEFYAHPGRPVATDGLVTARNYFSRPSAPEYDDEELDDEKDRVLAEVAELKKLSGWWMHPERPVECLDSSATARNFFSRPSAPEFDDEEMDQERKLILSETANLKKFASWYLHPEAEVEIHPFARARNVFSRPSATDYEDDEEAILERQHILAEAADLKKFASWYKHPEMPCVSTDLCATGRNFFSRPSAPEYEDFEEYQRELVLSDVADLKQLAMDYRHPEKGVVTSDPCVTGRNYFVRPSAPKAESFEEAEERTRILADSAALKKLAVDYLHPEKGVASSVAVGRDFFSRHSAPEYDDEDLTENREAILADARKLKEVASWYHHPETKVSSSVAVTRNFFTRPSAEEEDASSMDEEDKALVLADALALKKLAVDYLHPELPVVSSINCIRNFFDKPSAKGHTDYIHSHGHAIINHAVEHSHNDFDFHYQYYDHHHHDDDHSYHTQSDHFDCDLHGDDVFHEFRESLYAAHAVQEQVVPIIKEEKEGEEGNLSRSPSSVMLFDQEVM